MSTAYEYGITNIEYTEFQRLGICDEAQAGGSRLSKFPANTNVLYVGLKASDSARDCQARSQARCTAFELLPLAYFNCKLQELTRVHMGLSCEGSHVQTDCFFSCRLQRAPSRQASRPAAARHCLA